MPSGTEVRHGAEALAQLGTVADVCVNGVVGFAGLRAHAGHAGRRQAAGPGQQGVADRRRAGGPGGAGRPGAGHIVPVDSEHGAVHQCLAANAGGTT